MTALKMLLALVLAVPGTLAPVAAQEAPALRPAPQADTAPAEEVAPVLTVLDAADVDLATFQWVARPLVVFADSPADPRFGEQLRLLAERPFDMIARDVVVITDTDPAARTALRQKLRPRGFMLVLMGKDGGVKLRKPAPWSTREIGRSIDKFPLRQRELREARSG